MPPSWLAPTSTGPPDRVEYFFYCRDRPGTGELRMQLLEAHWSFMDDYAERMIARGPTLTDNGATPTGSLHIVDLPDAEAARVFAFEEPNYKAGVYAEVLVRRWRNLLGRTMWEFAGASDESNRYLVIALGDAEAGRRLVAEHEHRLIACGQLLSDDGSTSVGSALALEATSRNEVESLLADFLDRVEIHRWRFGGRP